MDAKTEKALRESIAKWEKNSRIRNLDNALVASQDCPLCVLHNPDINFRAKDYCIECPIAIRTHDSFCGSTPYETAYRAWDDDDITAFRAAAREEVAFLKSLLPENTQ